MYPNLRAEMARKGLTGKELAKVAGMTNATFSQKCNGKYSFTLDESKAIKEALQTDLPIEELFERKPEENEC